MLVLQKKTGTGTGWSISSMSYTGTSLNVASRDNTPRNSFISPDGLNFYFVGDQHNQVYHYSLATPWDISTETYLSAYDFDVIGETTPYGIDFKSDGTHMYMCGTGTDQVRDFLLTGFPWFTVNSSQAYGFSLPNDAVSPSDNVGPVRLMDNGTKLGVADWLNGTIHYYTLSTAYDLSSRTFQGSHDYRGEPHTLTYIMGFDVSPDGTRMFALTRNGYNYVTEYTLSTPYDVRTGTYVQHFDLSTQGSSGSGLFVAPSGDYLYVSDQATDHIYQYSL